MHRRISLLIAAVAVLCLAVAVPTASAGKKTDRAQNKKLKSHSKSIKKNSANIRKGAGAVKKLDSSTAAAGNAIAALKVIADRADVNAKTVLDAAPAIIKGLGDLKTGLESAGAGLVSLQNGLLGLQTAAGATEYGWIEVSATGGGGAQAFFLTPDIPDSFQQAQTSQTFVAPAGTTDVTTRFGVRGNESDGNGTTDAAHCVVSIVNQTANTNTTTAPTAVPTKSTLTATIGQPYTFVNTVDQPVTGPNLAALPAAVYTVKLACVDQTPSSTDPSA